MATIIHNYLQLSLLYYPYCLYLYRIIKIVVENMRTILQHSPWTITSLTILNYHDISK